MSHRDQPVPTGIPRPQRLHSPHVVLRPLLPVRAIRDLRLFLSQRQPYELVFLMIAVGITGFFIYAFARDDYVPVPYKPDIIYVEQWPADRTDVQIKAQQKIDYVKKKERLAEEKAAKEQRQAEFKRSTTR
ncbi:hypothetical protein GCM10020258_16380 [Sphingomonas yabuuchiae]